MKVLQVFGDGDYGANSFKNQHEGTKVSEIIANPEKFFPTEENDEDEQWNLEVHEFEGELNDKFIEFIRREMIDYDHTKHETFYVEGETV